MQIFWLEPPLNNSYCEKVNKSKQFIDKSPKDKIKIDFETLHQIIAFLAKTFFYVKKKVAFISNP